MKRISLYIARRYNTNTLLISTLLIFIAALLTGILLFIGDASAGITEKIFYPGRFPEKGEQVLIYVIAIIYVLLQTGLIYLLFRSLLRKINRKRKFLLSLVSSIFFGSLAGLTIYFNSEQKVFWDILSLIFISTSLLSVIFGFFDFLFSHRKITSVNIITSIAVFAVTIATCALFIILSVFSGLEKMNIEFFSSANADLKISPVKGKTLPDTEHIVQILDADGRIAAYSKTIEEKVSIEFDDKQDIAYIKGVDENYTKIIGIDTAVVHGHYFDFKSPYEILSSEGVARRLQMYIDGPYTARLRIPKPGKGLIKTEEEAFNTALADPIGIVIISDQFDKYIFSPLELTRELLELSDGQAYAMEIKLKSQEDANTVKNALQKELGPDLVVQTRQDMDATFLKVMNMENLIIYLIFTLVIIIASFNLAGAIIIIIIDKKEQIKTMWSFGMRISQIKKVFFQTGLLITGFSLLFGLILGTVIGSLQNTYHLVMANAFVAFPFEFTVFNYITVAATVLIIGCAVSFMVTRKLPV